MLKSPLKLWLTWGIWVSFSF